MYENRYHLSDEPFRYPVGRETCFPDRSSRAWILLRNALQHGEGIVLVTGPPGSRKAMVCERLLGEIDPVEAISVRLAADNLMLPGVLRALARALGLPVEGVDRVTLLVRIKQQLVELEQHKRRLLVVIEKAQKLSSRSLNCLRLLSDLQSQVYPVLQLALCGREGFARGLQVPGMEELQQRVIAACRLQPMDLLQTKSYLESRLAAVHWQGSPSINGPAVMAMYRHSQGIPRLVNQICNGLMSRASRLERDALDEQDVQAVADELQEELPPPLIFDAKSQGSEIDTLNSVYELALVPGKKPDSQAIHETRSGRMGKGSRSAFDDVRHSSAAAALAACSNAERTRSLVNAIARL